MADKRITELNQLNAASLQPAVDVLAVADVSAAETKKITAKDLVDTALPTVPDGTIPGSKIEENTITSKELAPDSVTDVELADNAVDTAAIQNDAVTTEKLADGSVTSDKLAADSVTADKIADGAVGGAQIADRSIPAIKLEANTLTAAEIAPNAIGASELANNAVDTAALADNAVTTAKLADNSVTNAKLADDAVGSAELADDSVNSNHIVDGAVDNVHLASGIDGAKLTDGSVSNRHLASGIDGAKLTAKSVPNTAIADNSLTADQIAPNSIGASELADNSVDTTAIVDNAVSTAKLQDASVTEPKLADGAVTTNKIADGSVTVNKLGDGAVTDDKIDGIGLDKLPNAPSGTVLAGPITGVAASPTYRRLEPSDIPTASATAKGGVIVPADGGLSIAADGSTGIANSVVPGGFPFVNFDKHGSITSGRALSNSDLPPPALGEIGGVKAGDGITITPDGTISQSLTGVVAETYTKVTVDEMGSVTAGAELVADDIPNIPWDKIENPVITPSELSDKSVQMRHLADYSIAFIQEQQPTVDQTVHIGTFWFKESTASLSQWNGNSWMSVGIGRLSAENLRYCGIFDATTGFITGLTQFGVAEGYEIGKAIPVATDDQTGVYFVCQIAGDQVAVLPGIALDPGDWCLCNGSAAGWERIDTMVGGGGGGGGATNLGDLLDVNIGAATTGALLQLQASGQWQDVYSIDAGDY